MEQNEQADFESKITNIQDILEKLGKEDITLKDGVDLYKKGVQEIKSAQQEIENAKAVCETLLKPQTNQQ